MATEQEQQELIETLKFTPRTYRISLWGYGGEIAIGSLTKEQYEFWKDKDEADLINHCTDYEDEDSGIDIPEEAKFCTDGAWYETLCDARSLCCKAKRCTRSTKRDIVKG